jgi:predicted DCC family thiol-disulfide oxidoreductase YuxK
MSRAIMDDKRPAAGQANPPKQPPFPPNSNCGSVPLRHLQNRVTLESAQSPGNPLKSMPRLLVYDGSCGFCSRSVQFILRHERRCDLLFVRRDSELGKTLRHRYHFEAVESLLWIADGKAFIESTAVLSAAKYLGGIWGLLATLGLLVPLPLRDWGYRFIARNRRRFSPGAASCLVPTAEQQNRFLTD